ncbi:hypothetical protein [Thermophagus xiamenensis]|uniref:Uncharacterized protein n=2 Tax=Thermophagus xiamenensis TaxID=385682 RepID=A0A1I1V599_9BACT|nr:hypothetical protein [Thermophagus xiamenensis]SFD78207.1 hypothetical protein SAMN05444380_10242 [Thermophagus xiamenensis]
MNLKASKEGEFRDYKFCLLASANNRNLHAAMQCLPERFETFMQRCNAFQNNLKPSYSDAMPSRTIGNLHAAMQCLPERLETFMQRCNAFQNDWKPSCSDAMPSRTIGNLHAAM